MKISLNGMMHEETQKSSDRGYKNNSGSNRKTIAKSNFYVIKKNQNTAEEFSSLILKEFKGRKFNHEHDYRRTLQQDSKYNLNSSLNKDEINAMNFLNEYWA